MPRSRSRGRPEGDLPPLLRRLVDAARHAVHADSGNNWEGHAEALAEFGQLALVTVPRCGALAPHENELYMAVDKVAQRHLATKKAKRAWRDAFEAIADADERDAIESAHLWVLSESDNAYFYTGLAFGITLAHLAGSR